MTSDIYTLRDFPAERAMKSRLNEALRLLRVFHDMSRVEAIEKLGISSSYLSEIESGAKNVSLDLLEKYSDAFNIPISSLMFFSESLHSDKPSERAKNFLSNRVIKILQWAEAVSDAKAENIRDK